jgi:hypothetical protein
VFTGEAIIAGRVEIDVARLRAICRDYNEPVPAAFEEHRPVTAVSSSPAAILSAREAGQKLREKL